MLKIYNTLSRKKENFTPISKNQVTMYVCGPTVYNDIHIGNARSVVAFDTVRRYLMYRGYQVKYVSNFTDVDDRMIDRAAEENVTVFQLADRVIKGYEHDVSQINVLPVTVRTRATQFIPQIIDFISRLIEKGYAYKSEGDVYFRTRKFQTYGELSDQSIADLVVGASEHVNLEEQSRKVDPLDFALWKGQKGDEIAWDSPFGKGRPGWHIECSVMSISELGETIDIHGGGEDLKFPHHENERAQSESLTEEPFVHYWMHNAFVTTAGDEKMSKSAGNFITLHEALKTYDANFLRFFLVQTNYRKPLQYSKDSIAQAKRNYDRIAETSRNLKAYIDGIEPTKTDKSNGSSLVEDFKKRFVEAMDDDFNIQNALTIVFEYLRWINKEVINQLSSLDELNNIQNLLIDWLGILGLSEPKTEEITDQEILDLINQRDAARESKDFKLSDELRDRLLNLGISIEDTNNGTKYTKK
ncbi:cysteine--tRNA ligase [Xylocopilactobacillus apis]|uniref:Cysteine--tRNA ligase n=1 Tax=Xylocopilactobacillus apis TaxID=2932183 RepID=A0AAU9D3C8_9LACO|nr:cysteine--tRNA ligase [Xylocopilactobacillus apis]BDR56795.1 cysteine--tRNA ligase [Xylocopilactobacillus apis]